MSTMKLLSCASLAIFALACNDSDVTAPVDTEPMETQMFSVSSAGSLLSIDFESYPLGPVGSPWGGYEAGSESLDVINTTNHGHVMRLVAGKATGDYLSYTTPFPGTSSTVTVGFDIRPGNGASPTFILRGSGYGASKNQLRLQRTPGSNALIAGTLSGPHCGNLTNGSWNHVVLKVNPTSKTFTVTINGAGVAACTNAPTTLLPPFKGISVFDPSNLGYGGTTDWDNFLVN